MAAAVRQSTLSVVRKRSHWACDFHRGWLHCVCMQRYNENCVRAPQTSRGLAGAREACCCATRVGGGVGAGGSRDHRWRGGSGRQRCVVAVGRGGAMSLAGESTAVGSVGIGFTGRGVRGNRRRHRRRTVYGGRGHSHTVPGASARADAKCVEYSSNLAFLVNHKHADNQQRQQHQQPRRSTLRCVGGWAPDVRESAAPTDRHRCERHRKVAKGSESGANAITASSSCRHTGRRRGRWGWRRRRRWSGFVRHRGNGRCRADGAACGRRCGIQARAHLRDALRPLSGID